MGKGFTAGAGHSKEVDGLMSFVEQAKTSVSNAVDNAKATLQSYVNSAKTYMDNAGSSAANAKTYAGQAETAKTSVTGALNSYYTKQQVDDTIKKYYTKAEIDSKMNGVQYPDGKLVWTGQAAQGDGISDFYYGTVTIPGSVSYILMGGVKIIRGGSGYIDISVYHSNGGSGYTKTRGTVTFSQAGALDCSDLRPDYGSAVGGVIMLEGYQYV